MFIYGAEELEMTSCYKYIAPPKQRASNEFIDNLNSVSRSLVATDVWLSLVHICRDQVLCGFNPE
jgi:hypothetical protein